MYVVKLHQQSSPNLYVHVHLPVVFNEWKKQLGGYIIDYNSLKIEETIAKGLYINSTVINCDYQY